MAHPHFPSPIAPSTNPGRSNMSEHTTDPTYTPVERHIFLCATPTKPKCHSDGTGADCWEY